MISHGDRYRIAKLPSQPKPWRVFYTRWSGLQDEISCHDSEYLAKRALRSRQKFGH